MPLLPVLVYAISRTVVKSSELELLTPVRLKCFQKPGGLPHAPLFESSDVKKSHHS